jgi:hypothetical protein
MGFLRCPIKDTGLLRITESVGEIATTSNQKTVGLLVMTDLDYYFHPHLLPQRGMGFYQKNTGMIFYW